MILYTTTIFLGAFLLFQVQPLIGKFLLPWFGGTAGVWATALVFFQTAVLLGYAYAHGVASWLRPRAQGTLHIALLGGTLLLLPIAPSAGWKPDGADDPALRILLVLAATVGAPYVMLAATGPLLQHWFTRSHPGRSPYRLYALSNVAALLALLTYPVFFERFLHLEQQTWLWSGCYAAYVPLCAVLAWRQRSPSRSALPEASPAAGAEPRAAAAGARAAGAFDVLLWFTLAAAASAMLLATTNRLTQDIAVIPFLWVLPLSLYLLSFILTFDHDRWYHRGVYSPALVVALGAVGLVIGRAPALPLLTQIALYCAALFFFAMSCHGELVRLRPGPHRLTLFYLAVAAGGALGGALVALGAPLVFDGFWEYHVSLIAIALAVSCAVGRNYVPRLLKRSEPRRTRAGVGAALVLVAGGVIALGWLLDRDVARARAGSLMAERNFYGVLRVLEVGAPGPDQRLELVHGGIAHGMQFVAQDRRAWHTSYYGPESGASLALLRHPSRVEGAPLHIGVVGLGTGSMASFGERGDELRFYEINPEVRSVARAYFSYLDDATARGAAVDVLLGDARLVLERQRDAGDLQRFDVLVLDAFNGDAVPVHLLTEQAFQLYGAHVAADGIIAVNVSNIYLDLKPVVRGLARSIGWQAYLVDAPLDMSRGVFYSQWVLVTNNEQLVADGAVARAVIPWSEADPKPVLWTDDFSNLLGALK